MLTTQEIAKRVYQKLKQSDLPGFISGEVAYERVDYSKEDVVVIPHDATGLNSRRFGAIKVNIHVPDINISTTANPTYIKYNDRLLEILNKVTPILKKHYEKGKGYNWTIESISPAMKEQGHNEHFISIHLSITIREKNI